MVRVFWKRQERETLARWRGDFDSPKALVERPLAETIEIERGVSRAAAISQVAEELRRRGEGIVEIFGMVASPAGQAVMPIRLRRDGKEVFVEIETGLWEGNTVKDILKTVGVLRGSEHSGAVFEVLSTYPVPEEIRYFFGQTPAALLQLDLVHHDDPEKPEACARAFLNAAERHWSLDLDYDPEELPLVEELLLAALDGGAESGASAPVLDALVLGLGCYAGELLRRHAASQGSWRSLADWGEDLVLEFPDVTADPVGKARAFLENGPRDSIAYYVAYALKELNA
jgi:hypothetical protein